MLQCKHCADAGPFENYRGARGHVKFKDDDEHGPEGDVPEDYRDLFEEIEGNGDDSSDSDDDSETESADDSSSSDGTSSGSSGGESVDETSSADESRDRGTIRKLLDTDLRDLIGS